MPASPTPTVFPNGIQGDIAATVVATLTDNSGGSTSTTIAAVSSTADAADAIASLAAIVNDLSTQVNALTGK